MSAVQLARRERGLKLLGGVGIREEQEDPPLGVCDLPRQQGLQKARRHRGSATGSRRGRLPR
jgi:hypothetical protein